MFPADEQGYYQGDQRYGADNVSVVPDGHGKFTRRLHQPLTDISQILEYHKGTDLGYQHGKPEGKFILNSSHYIFT